LTHTPTNTRLSFLSKKIPYIHLFADSKDFLLTNFKISMCGSGKFFSMCGSLRILVWKYGLFVSKSCREELAATKRSLGGNTKAFWPQWSLFLLRKNRKQFQGISKEGQKTEEKKNFTKNLIVKIQKISHLFFPLCPFIFKSRWVVEMSWCEFN
jgi:hypothetical protein